MAEEKEKTAEEVKRLIPPVDIYETENNVMLIADIPGVTKENLQVDIENDELTISGLFLAPKIDSGKKLINECYYGKYTRTFTLSDVIAQDKITAKLDDGVLTVTLPKQEKAKPKKITISTE